MMTLDNWVSHIDTWYQTQKHDQGIETLVLSVPDEVWGPEISELQSKAIACWLDACLRIFHFERYSQPDKAYQYLQLAYSKLQLCACNPETELTLKDWCMKRLQNLTVLSLEFCNQRPEAHWQSQSHQLIESHVQFMAAQSWNEPRNDDQELYERRH